MSDDVMKRVNEEFQKSKIPLKISYLVLFRPVFHELPFENLEIIETAKRFVACSSVHMVITMSYGDYGFEVELRYVNNNGKFANEWCRVLACDIYPDEDPEKIQTNLAEMAKLTGIIILATIDELD